MSIAVSAIVRPSPGLRLLQAGLGIGVMASAACCPQWPAAALCLVAGAAGLLALLRARRAAKAWAVDISGVGIWRLAVYQHAGAQLADGKPAAGRQAEGQQEDVREAPAQQADAPWRGPLRLLAGSTLWPGLLLLRLGAADGSVATLMVLPDSAAPAARRALALACRALAAHAQQAGGQHEIKQRTL